MKVHFIAAGLALAALFEALPAAALTLTLDKVTPAAVGQAQTFHVAAGTDAVGTVNIRWNFGDGTPTGDASTATQVSHTYLEPGHYTVLALGGDDVSNTSAVAIETVVNPLTTTPPSNSASILIDRERHQVWSTNPDSDTVSVIDQTTLMRVHEYPVGHEPHSLAQAPDKSIWVANQQSDEVVVLNRDTGAIETRIALPYASEPRSVVFGANGTAYVTLFATGKLVEIDGMTRKAGRDLALGPTPFGISVAADGRVFVTRFLSPIDHGEVWVVSPQTFTLASTITLPFDLGPDTQSSGRGVPNDVFSMVISPDGTQAWVLAKKDDVARGQQRDGMPMTSDNFVRTAVCKIDMKTLTEVVAQRQDIDNRSLVASVAFSPLGDYAFVLALASNWIGIMDAYSTQQVSGIRDVGHGPDGLLLDADGKLYVNAALSRQVIVYDVNSSLDSSDHAAPPPLATIGTTDHDLLTPQLLLGKQIFYNSADTRMGHAGYWSCASCHYGGISDGRVWDFTDRGEGLRNTKTLLGIRGAGQGRIHWSANMDEIQDLERDIRHDFGGSGFMSDADFTARLLPDGNFDTLGKPSAGVNADLDALAAYITSLAKVSRSPFRNPDGSFTKDAIAGRKIFQSAGCPACHNGPDFTDSATGVLHDVGTLLPTSANRLFQKLTGLDTPTLKGLWQSAPYLHDGRAATLAEVFTKYNLEDKMGVTSNLSPAEINQMVEYMLELDDEPETPATDVPASGGASGAGAGAGAGGSGGALTNGSAGRAAVPPAPTKTSSSCSLSVASGRAGAPFAGWLLGASAFAVWRRRARRAARVA
jgi:YVTN family beta-propeller protein